MRILNGHAPAPDSRPLVVLADALGDGHHPAYLRLYARTLLELGCRVTAFCPEPEKLRQWLAQDCPVDFDRFTARQLREPAPWRSVPRQLRGLGEVLARWVAVSRAVRSLDTRPDLVFLLWLDDYLYLHFGRYLAGLCRALVDRIFPFPWSGLYFRPGRFRGAVSERRSGRGSMLQSSHCAAIGVLDEGALPRLEHLLGPGRVLRFPDVADDAAPDRRSQLARLAVRRARGRRIVSVLGHQSLRKGTMTVLDLARDSRARKYFFVFAGELARWTFTPAELSRLANPPGNCLVHFERIPTDAEFNALVAVSDVLAAVYQDFRYSSNMLAKAALFEKPILVSRGCAMAESVAAYRLGLAVDDGNAGQLVEALDVLASPRLFRRAVGSPGFAAYRADHSTARLRSVLTRTLELAERRD